jgi:hypothetical protein
MRIHHSGPSIGHLDQMYLKLDASNDPVTGDLQVNAYVSARRFQIADNGTLDGTYNAYITERPNANNRRIMMYSEGDTTNNMGFIVAPVGLTRRDTVFGAWILDIDSNAGQGPFSNTTMFGTRGSDYAVITSATAGERQDIIYAPRTNVLSDSNFALRLSNNIRGETVLANNRSSTTRAFAIRGISGQAVEISQVQVSLGNKTQSVSANGLVNGFHASSTTSVNAGTAATSNANGGTIDWTNPSNALTSNNIRATAALAPGETTYQLLLTNFGLAIPTGARILGWRFDIETVTSIAAQVRFNEIKMIKGGSVLSTNRAITGDFMPTTEANRIYGDGNDLWGTTWTEAEAEASDTGLCLSFTNSGTNTVTAQVDSVTITCFYVTDDFYEGLDTSDSNAYKLGYGTTMGTNTYFRLGVDGAGLITNRTATVVPLTLRAAGSQSANILEWQDSSSTILGKIASNSKVTLQPSIASDYALSVENQSGSAGGGIFIQSQDGNGARLLEIQNLVNSPIFQVRGQGGGFGTGQVLIPGSLVLGASTAAVLVLDIYNTSGQYMQGINTNSPHGMTDWLTEGATFRLYQSQPVASGGIHLIGATRSDGSGSVTARALHLSGFIGQASPTAPAVVLNGAKKSGTTVQALASGEIVVEVENGVPRSGAVLTTWYGGGLVVNEPGNDYDFRVESADYDAINVDASDNALELMKNAAGKIGFFAVTPIVQPTTGHAAATFVANTSLIVDDSATYDGYTVGQVVKILRDLGVLA